MKKYSLVIPCFNEAENLPSLLARIVSTFSKTSGYEIILVDNGSWDATPHILAETASRHPSLLRSIRVEKNQGYGWGILQGLAVAHGDFLGWTHADMQTDPADALKGFALLEAQDSDMAFVKGRRHGRAVSDSFFSIGMSLFDSLLFSVPLWDINAQPSLLTRGLYQSWRNPPKDFALDLFVYVHAAQQQAKIARFPVHFGKRLHGVSHWNIGWRAKWKFIKKTIAFSLALKKSGMTHEYHLPS